MAQHDYVIANGTGAAVRSDLNNALAAIVSQNSGATEPATMYAYQWWADTTTGLLKIRNAANNAWVTVGTLASANLGLLSSGGTVTAALGSASTPGITFTGDTNTGIYSPGADSIAITTGGTQRLCFDSSGNIGYGISTPTTDYSTAFHIHSSLQPRIHLTNTTTGSTATDGGYILMDAADLTIANRESGQIGFQTNGSERVRITSAGLVGIGTSTPGELVHVYNSAATSRLIVGPNGTGAATPNALALEHDNTGYTVAHVRNIYNNAGLAELRLGGYGFTTFTSGSSQTERARIDSSGRLLVGTSTSTTGASSQYANLQVIGNGSAAADRGAIVNLGHSAASASVTTGEQIGVILFTDNAAGEYGMIGCYADANAGTNDYPGRLTFSTTADGASSPTERMRISQNGETVFYGNGSVTAARSNTGAGTGVELFNGYHSATGVTNGTRVIAIYTNGNIQNTNGSYTTLSDAKLKENIVDANSQWDDLKSIQIRNWNFKAETGHETHRQIGPIAQELETVCPGLVFETPDRDADGNETGEVTKGVNQSVLYMKAVKALQEAMERIEQLESEMAAVKAQLS